MRAAASHRRRRVRCRNEQRRERKSNDGRDGDRGQDADGDCEVRHESYRLPVASRERAVTARTGGESARARSGVRSRASEGKGVERRFGWLLTGDGAGSGRVVGEEEEDEEAEEREEGDEVDGLVRRGRPGRLPRRLLVRLVRGRGGGGIQAGSRARRSDGEALHCGGGGGGGGGDFFFLLLRCGDRCGGV